MRWKHCEDGYRCARKFYSQVSFVDHSHRFIASTHLVIWKKEREGRDLSLIQTTAIDWIQVTPLQKFLHASYSFPFEKYVYFYLPKFSTQLHQDSTTNGTAVTIICNTGSIKGSTKNIPTRVRVTGVTTSKSDPIFTYMPNPDITSITRTKSIKRWA